MLEKLPAVVSCSARLPAVSFFRLLQDLHRGGASFETFAFFFGTRGLPHSLLAPCVLGERGVPARI
jgi:hypothetical protein